MTRVFTQAVEVNEPFHKLKENETHLFSVQNVVFVVYRTVAVFQVYKGYETKTPEISFVKTSCNF